MANGEYCLVYAPRRHVKWSIAGHKLYHEIELNNQELTVCELVNEFCAVVI